MTTRGISANGANPIWSRAGATYLPVITGNVSGYPYSAVTYNITDNATNTSPAGGDSGFMINMANYGGDGYRTGLTVINSHNTASSTPQASAFYTAAFPQMYVNASDGGTGLTPANAKGAFYGLGAIVTAANGATNLYGVTNEIDVNMETGSSAMIKSGLSIIGGGLGGTRDNVAGTLHDSLLSFCTDSNTNVRYRSCIVIGREDAYWPVISTGAILSCAVPAAGVNTCATGIDLSGATISGDAYKSTGFSVSGSGALTATFGTFTASSVNIKLRDSNVAVTAGGLHRVAADGSGGFVWQINYAAGGDFSSAWTAWSCTSLGNVGISTAAASTSSALNLPAGTTANSSVRIAHGAAPTSPVDGDMWTTTAGLFIRINGVTKTVTLT